MSKPPPPEPPPMRQHGARETEQSKRETQEWRERLGITPPLTTEIRFPRKPRGGPTLVQVIKWFHFLAMIFWVLMIYPTIVYWKESVPYLVFLSIYTVIIDHAGAWATARIERNTEKKEASE